MKARRHRSAVGPPSHLVHQLGRRLRPVPDLPRRAGRRRGWPSSWPSSSGGRGAAGGCDVGPLPPRRSAWSACSSQGGPGSADRRRPSGRAALEHRHAVLRRQIRRAVRSAAGRTGRLPRLAPSAQDGEPPVRRLLRAACGGGSVRPLRPCPGVARTLAQHSGRHRARGLRRHVGGRLGRAGHRAAQPDPGCPSGGAATRRSVRTAAGAVDERRAARPCATPAGARWRDVDRALGAAGGDQTGERSPGRPDAAAAGTMAATDEDGWHAPGGHGRVSWARFSTMAGISFAGILVAGTLLAIAEVGSVANLFETGYGQLLLLKIALVGLLLFLAWYNRLPPPARPVLGRRRHPARGAGPGLAAARLHGAAGGPGHGGRPGRDRRAGQRDTEQRRQRAAAGAVHPDAVRSTADTSRCTSRPTPLW